MDIATFGTWRILVVDDELDTCELLSLVLSPTGAQVDLADNGSIAWELYQQESPNLVLTDISMPEMDGFELLNKIREQGHQIPVIALTAHAMSGDKARVMAAGFSAYMAKPLRLMTLLDDLLAILTRLEG